ncbi:MAG: type II toxin-antitoxin system RelE/ParE family toxin [Fibromonadales bacterium]|nr:type II toxin-antitoxin system RelE/ParE family toxin [Fibromonadales bacterium]
MTTDEIEIKSAYTTPECDIMLKEAVAFIKENSPKQAGIMIEKFRKIKNLLETFPEIGTLYKNGMRKFKLGKFRYNIYYRIKEKEIEIVGIWHTSRGTEFEEP